MSGDDLEQPDLFDTLVVPFIFVPHGRPEPREWLAEHPGHQGSGGAGPAIGVR